MKIESIKKEGVQFSLILTRVEAESLHSILEKCLGLLNPNTIRGYDEWGINMLHEIRIQIEKEIIDES